MLRLIAAIAVVLVTAAWGDLTWDFESPDELMSANHMEGGVVSNGTVFGQTTWDPYIFMRMPELGHNVSELPYLTVRMYSSEDADSLAVYYKCTDGLWGLGNTLPVKKGWAVYRADMREALWTESGMAAEARQWGGRNKQIIMLRIDPGNQAGRWVVVDRVTLSSEPGGDLGVELEPRGTAQGASVQVPAEVQAGEGIPVGFSCAVGGENRPKKGSLLVAITGPKRVLQVHVLPVNLDRDELSAEDLFPTSKYSFGGDMTVTARVLELDGEARAPVKVVNPLVGRQTPPVTEVRDFNGDPSLYVNGKPEPLITYLHHGGEAGKLHGEMRQTGIHVFSDWFGASVAGDLGRSEDGTCDYARFDDYFTTVLEAVPEARFLPHIGVVAPLWWQKQHPDECCVLANGDQWPSSMASKLWMEEMSADLRKLIEHLRKAPYADRILGYIFYAGYTAEWQSWGTWQASVCDYSPPAVKGFRDWLRERYGTDEALRKAWANAEVTFETATVPSADRRLEAGDFLLDPAKDRQIIDYNLYSSDFIADAIRYFARATKEAVGGSQIVGTYYGYMAAHGARQQVCGHNALAQVLACPDIDFLMSPPMYAHRNIGETSTFMSATESVKLHGKLWFDESDLRSYLSDPGAGYGRTKTPEHSVATTWREFANVVTRKAGVSWFDMSGGWFSGQPMWDAYRRQMEIIDRVFTQRRPYTADVALFVDERSYAHYRRSNLTSVMVQETVSRMPEMGATWDMYLTSDLDNPALPAYKLYAVLNSTRMDPETARRLLEKARVEQATILWMYAPGYSTDSGFDHPRLEQVTGMQVQVQAEGAGGAYHIEPGTGFAAGIDGGALLGPETIVSPRFAIIDAEAEPIARYADSGQVAIGRKIVDGVQVIYCAPVAMPIPLWRNIARECGAHIWLDSGDGIYTDGQYLAIHAAADGTKTVRVPGPPRSVENLVTGEKLAESTNAITLEMKMGETVSLYLTPAE